MNEIKKEFYHTVPSKGTFIGVRTNEKVSHPTLNRLFEMMKKRGWEIQFDQSVKPLLAKSFFKGKKGDLSFTSHKYPAGFEIEFFQEIYTINRYGGKYDFDKLSLMPYLIRCSFLVELGHIKKFLKEEGYEDKSQPSFKYAADEVYYRIKSSWDYVKGKELPDFSLPDYYSTDKDGKRIKNGELKFFRDRKGRLQKGIVYHNTKNMWWVILNKYEFTNEASFCLFDLDTEENRKRKLIKSSGYHNPKSRNMTSLEKIKHWKKQTKKDGKEKRINQANEFLEYLYSLNWVSRKFQIYLKDTNRLGLLEMENRSIGIHRIFNKPKDVSLNTRNLSMSSTESSLIKGIREYVIHGRPTEFIGFLLNQEMGPYIPDTFRCRL